MAGRNIEQVLEKLGFDRRTKIERRSADLTDRQRLIENDARSSSSAEADNGLNPVSGYDCDVK